jgi:predicted transcriptional regulator
LRGVGTLWHLPPMSDSPNIKPEARRLVDSLPDSATWDDLAYEVYVRQSVEAGLADADAGRVLGHDDALARVRARIRRAS